MRIHSRMKTVTSVVILVYIGLLPLILANYNSGRAYFDQDKYHYPAIVHFTRGFDVSDYQAATTPGYHILMAWVAKGIPDSELALKLVNSIFTAALFALFAGILAPRFGLFHTIALILPALTSLYLFTAGAWLLPDNLAWLTVLFVLLLVLRLPDDFGTYMILGMGVMLAVLIRQSNIWLLATVWVSAIPICIFHPPSPTKPTKQITGATLVTVAVVLVLAYFIYNWGSLVPPSFADRHESFNFAAPAFFLSLFFTYSVFFIPYIFQPSIVIFRKKKSLILGCVILGLMVALIPHTDWNWTEGRASGLWNVAKITPSFGHRSLLICILSALGGCVSMVWLQLVKKSTRWILSTGILAFVASQTVNQFVFEKYYAGFIFIVIYLLLRDIPETNKARVSNWYAGFPSLFALLNLGILVRALVG